MDGCHQRACLSRNLRPIAPERNLHFHATSSSRHSVLHDSGPFAHSAWAQAPTSPLELEPGPVEPVTSLQPRASSHACGMGRSGCASFCMCAMIGATVKEDDSPCLWRRGWTRSRRCCATLSCVFPVSYCPLMILLVLHTHCTPLNLSKVPAPNANATRSDREACAPSRLT